MGNSKLGNHAAVSNGLVQDSQHQLDSHLRTIPKSSFAKQFRKHQKISIFNRFVQSLRDKSQYTANVLDRFKLILSYTNLTFISSVSDGILQEFGHLLIRNSVCFIGQLINASFVEDSWSPIVNLNIQHVQTLIQLTPLSVWIERCLMCEHIPYLILSRRTVSWLGNRIFCPSSLASNCPMIRF